MDIKTTKRTLLNSYMAAYKGFAKRKSWLLKGKHGLGKSQVIAQIAASLSEMLKIPFGIIDIRLGQYEIGDLLGLQRINDAYTIVNKVFVDGALTEVKTVANNVAVHDLPLWFPRDPDWHGMIFLDEITGCSRDLQHWAMQAVLEYRVNFVDFSPGTMVVAAGNIDPQIYNVIVLNPALKDRFGEIEFEPTYPEWDAHAEQIGVHMAVRKYLSKFASTDLDPPDGKDGKEYDPLVRYPSRRSWVSLSEEITGFADLGDDPLGDFDYLHFLSAAWVGPTVAVNFVDFVKKDYKVYTPDEILNGFDKLKDEFKQMLATDLSWYNKEIVKYIAKKELTLNAKQHENLWGYFSTIPREVASGFWSMFSKDCRKQTVTFNKDPKVDKYARSLFNKALSIGEAK